MKSMEFPQLAQLSQWLTGKEVDNKVLTCRIEAYSCKRGGDEKRTLLKLEEQMVELSKSPGTSPHFGPLSDSTTRKMLIYLITTMNTHFPDYDFSDAGAGHFRKLPSAAKVVEKIDADLGVLGNHYHFNLKDQLHKAIEACIRIKECAVYTYVPDMEEDGPFSEGWLGHFNYFFYNRKLKRILYFTCVARSRYLPQRGFGGSAEGSELMGDVTDFDESYHDTERLHDANTNEFDFTMDEE